jgi:hypothetical protein
MPYGTRLSCPNLAGNDPIENSMDLTDDAGMFNFTNGQSQRMYNVWLSYRQGQ